MSERISVQLLAGLVAMFALAGCGDDKKNDDDGRGNQDASVDGNDDEDSGDLPGDDSGDLPVATTARAHSRLHTELYQARATRHPIRQVPPSRPG